MAEEEDEVNTPRRDLPSYEEEISASSANAEVCERAADWRARADEMYKQVEELRRKASKLEGQADIYNTAANSVFNVTGEDTVPMEGSVR